MQEEDAQQLKKPYQIPLTGLKFEIGNSILFGEAIMVTANMIPSKLLIEAMSAELKQNQDVFKPPEWAPFVKLSVARQNAPENRGDWWYSRVASVLRKIYLHEPIGVLHLRKMYGSRRNRGSKPERTFSGSGAVVRHAIHQLEKAGYVTTRAGYKGRVMSPEGRSFVDNIAFQVKKQIPELEKY
ncbi:MAG: 30S ribosomal protein S19e [Candidatus Heimdallarchaeota archaeon]